MAFFPPDANYASAWNYSPSIGMHDRRDADWMLASPQSPQTLRRDNSLESIGQFHFSHPLSQHEFHGADSISSKGSRRVKWNKNVKNGRKTVGCAAFQQRCSALPSSFVDVADTGTCALPSSFVNVADTGTSEKPLSLLQRFADVAISNVQKCGVGIGRQCGGRGCANVSVLSSMIGGEMCAGCGVEDEGNGFAQGRCPQCQSYFHDDRNNGNIGLRRHNQRPLQVKSHMTQLPTHRHSSNYHANDNSFQDAILHHRNMVSHQPLMEPRMEMIRSSNEQRAQYGAGGYSCEWGQYANTPFHDDENDRYAMNTHLAPQKRYRRHGNRRTVKETTKLFGRCVVKSLSNPVQRLKHGMQRNGVKRILTITRGR